MKRKKRFFIFKAIFLICWLCIINNRLSSASPEACQNCLTALMPKMILRVERLDGNTEIKPGIRELKVAADYESNPVKSCYILFYLEAIPPHALVDSLTLRLYLKSQNDPQGYQLVKVYNVNNLSDVLRKLNGTDAPSLKAIGSGEVNDQTPIIDFEYKIPEETDRINWLKVNRSGFALMLSSPSEDQDYSYYSKAEDGSLCTVFGQTGEIPCYHVQPRLIVKYSMPPMMRPSSDWSQYNYDPQHSGRTPWKIYFNPKEVERKVKAEHKTVYSPVGYIKGDPVVYDNDLFFHTQLDAHPSGKKFFITAVSGTGKPLWDRNVDEAVKFQPIVDRCGLMYVVTENRFIILDLCDRGNILKGTGWGDLLRTEQVSIRSTPTIGYNGALYLSTSRGIYALTPYPDLDILWNYTTDEDSFGRITLSENEATAYVIDGETGKLVAIDAVDGTEKWRKGGFKKDGNGLPVPVVGKKGYIYVTNGYYAGDYLQILDARGNTIKKMTSGEISQPVIDSKGNAYFIQKERGLCRCDPDDPNNIQNNGDKLNASSIIVMNGNDNIYVIDRFSNPQQVKGYTAADLKEIFTLSVQQTRSQSDGNSTNFMENLLIAPDGTLYTRNDNHLFAITIRDSSIDNLSLTKDMIRKGNETAFRSMDSLTVEEKVSINKMKSIIIQSGKTIEVEKSVSVDSTSSVVFKSGVIGFNPGFRVEKGARLICKTGF